MLSDWHCIFLYFPGLPVSDLPAVYDPVCCLTRWYRLYHRILSDRVQMVGCCQSHHPNHHLDCYPDHCLDHCQDHSRWRPDRQTISWSRPDSMSFCPGPISVPHIPGRTCWSSGIPYSLSLCKLPYVLRRLPWHRRKNRNHKSCLSGTGSPAVRQIHQTRNLTGCCMEHARWKTGNQQQGRREKDAQVSDGDVRNAVSRPGHFY